MNRGTVELSTVQLPGQYLAVEHVQTLGFFHRVVDY